MLTDDLEELLAILGHEANFRVQVETGPIDGAIIGFPGADEPIGTKMRSSGANGTAAEGRERKAK